MKPYVTWTREELIRRIEELEGTLPVSGQEESIEKLRQENRLLRLILDSLPFAVFAKDCEEFRYLYRNDHASVFANCSTEEGFGKTDFEIFPPQIAQRYVEEDYQVLSDGKPLRTLFEDKYEDGRRRVTDKYKMLVGDAETPLLLGVGVDVTAQYEREQELSEELKLSKESDALKSVFLTNLSYEIRTPLNAIVGFSRVIAETEEAETRKEYYQIVEENNVQLLKLINSILDLSRLESGHIDVTESAVDLVELSHELFDAYSMECGSHVRLICEASDETSVIYSDRPKLYQIFSNLIDNAVKFSFQGTIAYGYRRMGGEMEFYVRDTGIGIAPEHLPHVFDRFMKVDSFSKGTGLGLTICKSVVEKLGGTIRIDSVLGKGTTVSFRIPCVSTDETAEPGSFPGMEQSVQERKDIKILIAEDTMRNYQLLQVMIGNIYTLLHAVDGVEAVSMYEQHHPDLIIMDIRMPVMNGSDAAQIIRNLSPDVPIIALSAYAYDEDKQEALNCGCNEFLSKPVSFAQLMKTLNKYI